MKWPGSGERRHADRGPDIAAIRATTQELRDLIPPFREEQTRMAELVEQLHAALFGPEDEE